MINSVRLVISQKSMRDNPSEWDMPIDKLDNFIGHVQHIGRKAFAMVAGVEPLEVSPGDAQCLYCPAKLDCEGYARLVAETALGGFDDLTEKPLAETKTVDIPEEPNLLARYYLKIGLIRKWCDAVEAAALVQAEEGKLGEAHGLKLVKGRRGNRAWEDPAVVEELLKGMKIPKDQMYDFKLISPATAEKVFAESPRRWKKIQEHITQKTGKAELVPLSDKRPPIPRAATTDGLEESIDDLI